MGGREAASTTEARRDLLPLWRNRDFILLWGGQVVSTIGTRISSIAFPLLVLALTNSPAKAGIVGFAQSIPYLLFFLPAGALVDRWDRKRIMLVAEGGRAVAFASIPLTIAFDRLTLPQIVAVAFIEGGLFVFFMLSESSALPQVVPKEQLPTALAQNQARQQGADLAGQPLGGVLFGLSRMLPFIVDAASYAVGFVTLLFVRPAFQEERPRSETRLAAEVVEGFVWLWRQRFLRAAVMLVAGSNFVFSALVLVLIVRAEELGASPSLIGAMFAFFGGGALVGSVLAPWVQRNVPTRVVVVGSLWLWAATTASLALLPNAVALGLVSGVAAVSGPPFNVVLGSYRYALVPDRLLGRVQSAALVIAWGATPLGSLAAGFLLQEWGAVSSLLVLTAIAVVVAALATAIRTVREAPELETLLAQRDPASIAP